MGYLGASTGAAAALVASRHFPVAAIVCRAGRPDLVEPRLPSVRPPTLLLVGERDPLVRDWNLQALKRLGSRTKRLHTIRGASHLFKEPGTLEEVARLAQAWFVRHLGPPEGRRLL